LFQGQVRDSADVLHRCLVSLPCAGLRSTVTFVTDLTLAEIRVEPARKQKVRAAIEAALDYLDARELRGTASVQSNIEEGKGYGSSTADCVAAVRAVADAVGTALTEDEIARLVVGAETASDSTMFGQAVLFAQREGRVLERYARPIPRLEVLGIDTSPGEIVDTLSYPPAVYSWRDVEVFHMLVAALGRAIRTQDVALLGRVATASAVVNERFLPKPLFAEIRRIAECGRALGVAVAHSGTILSILLDPADPSVAHRIERLSAELERLGTAEVIHFSTSVLQTRYAWL
jgi:uncharacterized protein involved in propanediol utilization